MNRHLKKLIALAVFCFLLAGPAQAQPRVATVNLEQLFDQYWKTGLLRAALKAKGREFDQTDQQMTADLQKARDQYQKLLDQSNNRALSSEQHAKYQQAAEDQLEHIRELEYNRAAFERQASATLAERESHARKELLAEISTVIANVARAKGYSLVIDAETQGADADLGAPDLPPVVVYADGTSDLTQSVLSQLNAGAPVDTLAANRHASATYNHE